MASSTKVKFNLETLREKSLEAIDVTIEETSRHVASFEDESAFRERVSEWRRRQEERVDELFKQVSQGEITDQHLAEWEVEPVPCVDPYDKRRAEHKLRQLIGERARIVAKSSSLVADEDGTISLTKTQLSEFFGL